MNESDLKAAVKASFIGELEAFKPGNVSSYADGHDMTAQDFIKSAEVTTPLLCEHGTSLGQRVYNSVEATQKAVGCNTNLGMLLLFSPIIMAAEDGFGDKEEFKSKLQLVLDSLGQEDANQIFAAISMAKPGGLGKDDKYDVNESPQCSLLEAMEKASERDFVALQYTNGFQQIFDHGFDTIKYFVKCWNSVKWSTVGSYLMFLSSWKDSHIKRKFGDEIAEQIRIKTIRIFEEFKSFSDPESGIEMLTGFDEELKAKNYNPGTSADLTAASLLVYNLSQINRE